MLISYTFLVIKGYIQNNTRTANKYYTFLVINTTQ